ncbi:MAG TPA: hypothetical protein VFI11_13550 [Anaerolineales bacterium]|nr:hypothetical protein [Anaerolineales bacterium]
MKVNPWAPVLMLLALPLLAAGPAEPALQEPTATLGSIIIAPSPTPPIIIIQPSRTPTPPVSSVQTRTPTASATPTLPEFTLPSPTLTPLDFGAEMPPTITPHGDPYFPDFDVTLPSPTPTQVTFKGPDVPDLYITDFEVTQGMQNLDNDMPLVQERTTVARVYVCTDSVDWPDVRGGIQAWRNDQPLSPGPGEPAGKALLPANGPITAWANCGDRLNVDDSLYFYLPPHWLSGEVTLRAFVYGTDPQAPFLYEESDSNNFKTVYDLEFEEAKAITFRFIPLHLHEGFDNDNPNVTFFPTDVTFGLSGGWDIAHDMFRLHPIAEMFVELAGEPISPAFHWLGDEWELDDEDKYGKPLDRLQQYRYWEDDAPWYIGMVSPSLLGETEALGLARAEKGVAWVIMDPSHGSLTLWHVEGGVTLAHELGHLAGLDHAPCADDDGDGEADEEDIDGDFPTGFPNCSLAPVDPEGFYGFDVNWELWGFLDGPTVISNDPGAAKPHRGFPLMGYVTPNYIDAYHYCLLLERYGVHCNPDSLDLGPQGGGGGTGPHADCDTHDNPFPGPLVNWELCITSEGEPELYRPSTWDSVIIVSGEVDPQAGTAEFDHVAVLNDPPPSLIAEMEDAKETRIQEGDSLPYLLSLETAEGRPLVFQALVDNDSHHSPPDRIAFSEALPYVSGGAILRLRSRPVEVDDDLSDLGEILGERRASRSAPQVQFVDEPAEPARPPFELHWTASDPDGDPLTFTLLYRPGPDDAWQVVAEGAQPSGGTTRQPFGVLSDERALPGGTSGQFRIVVQDGFQSASDDSAPLYSLPNRSPLPLIYIPGEGLVLPANGVVVLKGAATDAEDGPLPAESLQWSSDRDGPLGQGGHLVQRGLSPGVHTLTLSATDSSGETATAVVHIAVDPNVVRWLPDENEQAALHGILTAAGGPAEPEESPAVGRLPAPALIAIAAGVLLVGAAGVGLVLLGLRRRPGR